MKLTAEMVMGALQGFTDSGQRFVPTSEIQRAVRLAYPDVVIHQGAVNARLRRLEHLGRVNSIIDAHRGVDTYWEALEPPTTEGDTQWK